MDWGRVVWSHPERWFHEIIRRQTCIASTTTPGQRNFEITSTLRIAKSDVWSPTTGSKARLWPRRVASSLTKQSYRLVPASCLIWSQGSVWRIYILNFWKCVMVVYRHDPSDLFPSGREISMWTAFCNYGSLPCILFATRNIPFEMYFLGKTSIRSQNVRGLVIGPRIWTCLKSKNVSGSLLTAT